MHAEQIAQSTLDAIPETQSPQTDGFYDQFAQQRGDEQNRALWRRPGHDARTEIERAHADLAYHAKVVHGSGRYPESELWGNGPDAAPGRYLHDAFSGIDQLIGAVGVIGNAGIRRIFIGQCRNRGARRRVVIEQERRVSHARYSMTFRNSCDMPGLRPS